MAEGTLSEFYRNKRVVVTGGAGFLGSHLVKMLRDAGAVVYVPRSNDCDLRDPLAASSAIYNHDVCFHLAAKVSGISSTSASPVEHLRDNALMALSVIQACCMHNVKAVVAGSVCAYPQHTPMPMIEENLWNGEPEPTNASYGEAKRLALATLQAYHKQHDLKCAYLLSANLYGPGDHFDPQTSHVIPALIRKIDHAQKAGDAGICVWGSGGASRDFLYVEDAARAYMLAGELIDCPTPINIGSGTETHIAWLVEELKNVMGFHGDTVFDRSKPDGQPRRCLRIWKAQDMLGWNPTTTLSDGLRKTVEWYRENVK